MEQAEVLRERKHILGRLDNIAKVLREGRRPGTFQKLKEDPVAGA